MRHKAYQLRQSAITLLLNIRDALVSGGPLVFLAIGLVVLAYWWLKPNPPSEVNAGRVNMEVRFAPLKPAEFVVIRISQKTQRPQS